MALNIILIAIVVVSLGAIGFIIVRRFPQLRTLDVNTVPEAKKAEVRDRILIERMKRNTRKGRELIGKGAKPVFALLGRLIKRLFQRIYALEKQYKKEEEGKIVLRGDDLAGKVRSMLETAVKLIREEKLNDAEKIYIEIISFDPKNTEAYKGLVDVYLSLKEFRQALQTAQFILRLEQKRSKEVMKEDEKGQVRRTFSNAHDLARAYIDLGYICEMMDKKETAFASYEKALELEPNNPRNITLLLDLCLTLKKKPLALDLLKRLEEANPENQKLKEYENRILEM